MKFEFLDKFSQLSESEREAWFNNIETPIIETIADQPQNYAVTFIYKLNEDDISKNASIYLLSGLTGYDFKESSKFIHFPASNLAYLTLILPNDTRATYNLVKLYDELSTFKTPDTDASLITYPKPNKELAWFNNLLGFLFENGRIELDIHNNNKITYFKDMDNPTEIYGEESILELPKAPFHTNIPKSFTEIKNTRDELTRDNRLIMTKYNVTSTGHEATLLTERKYWIYLPKDYNQTSSNKYPLLVFLDGSSYLDYIPAHCILEDLIKNDNIPPCIAIFIDFAEGPSREQEYNCNAEFTKFLAETFIPSVTVKHSLNIADSADSRIIIGSSMSGCAAFYAALTYPESFGKAIMQSPCFLLQKLDNLKTLIDNSQKSGQFIFEVGKFEKNAAGFEFADGTTQSISTYESVQIIKNHMQTQKMNATLHEFVGGHNYICYRESLHSLISEIFSNHLYYQNSINL